MIVRLVIIAGALVLMGAVAWHAHITLPTGQLPMGRTNSPNTNRLVVLLQMPLIYLIVLIFVFKDWIEGDFGVADAVPVPALLFLSALMLATQQAQLWGVRRIMRNCR